MTIEEIIKKAFSRGWNASHECATDFDYDYALNGFLSEVETEVKKFSIASISGSSRYFIAVDPHDRLTWWQNLLKKTGLFYRNRPKSSVGIFIWKEDGTAEWKNCR
jgi:hypothetical protein